MCLDYKVQCLKTASERWPAALPSLLPAQAVPVGRPNPLVHKGRGYQAAASTLQEAIPVPIAAVGTLWMDAGLYPQAKPGQSTAWFFCSF